MKNSKRKNSTRRKARGNQNNSNFDQTGVTISKPNYSNKDILYLGLGFPKKLRATLRYSDNISISGPDGDTQSLVYRCNSIFAPNATVASPKAYYFNQFMAVYDHYCVMTSRIRVTLVRNLNTADGIIVTLSVQDSLGQTVTNPTEVLEQSSASRVIIPPGALTSYKMTKEWDAIKYFSRNPLGNPDLEGSRTTTPTEESYFAINTKSISGVDTYSIYAEVLIEYDVIFKELLDVEPST